MEEIKLAAEKKRLQSLYDTNNWFGINPLQVIDYIERIEELEKACRYGITALRRQEVGIINHEAIEILKAALGEEASDA